MKVIRKSGTKITEKKSQSLKVIRVSGTKITEKNSQSLEVIRFRVSGTEITEKKSVPEGHQKIRYYDYRTVQAIFKGHEKLRSKN